MGTIKALKNEQVAANARVLTLEKQQAQVEYIGLFVAVDEAIELSSRNSLLMQELAMPNAVAEEPDAGAFAAIVSGVRLVHSKQVSSLRGLAHETVKANCDVFNSSRTAGGDYGTILRKCSNNSFLESSRL